MNARTTIKKVLFVTIWVCIGGGMLTLLLAAINKKNKGECKDYSIVIKGSQNNLFIDRNDIEQMLKQETRSTIKGMPIASFRLNKLEQVLESNTWISKAELYFDNGDVLHVTITEKEPVARIFTTGTTTYYIDSAGQKMPLSEKLSARVPVFTGFPDKKILTGRDSSLLNDVRKAATYIINDPFWMSQVAQIDITPERTFEMIPVIGNHTVKLGNGEDIDQKFHRLMVFYKQILSKTGFDKYKIIDVQYEGQVVTSKYGAEKSDTALLRKNVEKLLKQSRDVQNDTAVRSVAVVNSRNSLETDPATTAVGTPKGVPARLKPVKADQSKTNDNSSTAPKKQPKAVMPPKNQE